MRQHTDYSLRKFEYSVESMEITPAALESTQTTGCLLDPATGAGNDVTDEDRRIEY